MFFDANSFRQDLSAWTIKQFAHTRHMFIGCPLYEMPDKLPRVEGTSSRVNAPQYKGVNEDYIEKVSADDIKKQDTLIQEEIDIAVEHAIRGKYDPEFDIDLQQFIAVYKPKDRNELINVIAWFTQTMGNNCSLNWIDTSEIRDMHSVFQVNNQFNGDISKWDVSRVESMFQMFMGSEFNGDISSWNVSKVADFAHMFRDSKFNSDISKWNTKSAGTMFGMFGANRYFDQDISKWDVSNVNNFINMFYGASSFN